ncbi:MAG: aminotransferase class V-fold PLP-dependent enzyme [Planctomycetota bacterium]
MQADPLLRWRPEFPISERTTYLVSNSLGAMPTRARARMAAHLDQWDERGVRSWAEGWWVAHDEIARPLERILGVDANTVSMHQNVAVASQMILSCFDFSGPRRKIVLLDSEFPSLLYLYESQRARGAEIVRVPADASGVGVDLERLLAAIDERTLLVPISHALFRSAFVQDARAVAERARQVGAFLILDVFQSVGTVPLRLAEWGVHAAVGGALKFLCGGPGNGFLYVDPGERARLRPSFTGWMAHTDPFAFARTHALREDGWRFLHGTPNVPAIAAGVEGVKIVAEIGVEAIRHKSVRQTALLVARAQHHGFAVHAPLDPAQRGGTVAVRVPHGYEVCQTLLAEDIVVDFRPDAGIRVAPHFYTSDEECVAAIDRMAEIVGSKAYERFLQLERKPG